MPVPLGIPVTLAEVLEVRSGPLLEEEVWSLLFKGIDTLTQLVKDGKATADGLSLESITCYPEGGVQVISASSAIMLRDIADDAGLDETPVDFTPPESKVDIISVDLEKANTYSLGAVMQYCLLYGDQGVNSSVELFSLLNMMTLNQPNGRMSVKNLNQMIGLKMKMKSVDADEVISSIYRTIMRSNPDLSILTNGHDKTRPLARPTRK